MAASFRALSDQQRVLPVALLDAPRGPGRSIGRPVFLGERRLARSRSQELEDRVGADGYL